MKKKLLKNGRFFIGIMLVSIIGITTSSPITANALDWNRQMEFTSVSVYNTETHEMEYTIITEDDDGNITAGYDAESKTSTISGGANYASASWDGTVVISQDSFGNYTFSKNTTFTPGETVFAVSSFPYSWNGSSDGDADSKLTRLSATGQDYQRANMVVSELTNQLNAAIDYIFRGTLEDSNIDTDTFLKNLQSFNANLNTALQTGTATGTFGESGCEAAQGVACYPYTLTKVSSLDNVTEANQTIINNSDTTFADGGLESMKYENFILIQPHIDGIGYNGVSIDENTTTYDGQVFQWHASKGYGRGEDLYSTLNSAHDDYKNTSGYVRDIEELGISNDYSWGMMIGQALHVYTGDENIKSAADFNLTAMESSESFTEQWNGNGAIDLVYFLTQARPMNEAISPFANGMSYSYFMNFIPFEILPVVSFILTLSTVIFAVMLVIVAIARIYQINANKYDPTQNTVLEYFGDLGFIIFGGFLNVVMIPVYFLISKMIVSILVLAGTPPGYAPGTYEIGSGLYSGVIGYNQIVSFIWAGVAQAYTLVIVFAYVQAILRFMFGPIFAFGFHSDKEGKGISKLLKYHFQLMWIIIAKFSLFALGYLILAQLQYYYDIPVIIAITLTGILTSLPAMILKMLGWKFNNIVDGAAFAGMGVGAMAKMNSQGMRYGSMATTSAFEGAPNYMRKRREDKIDSKGTELSEKKDKINKGDTTDGTVGEAMNLIGELGNLGEQRIKSANMSQKMNMMGAVLGPLGFGFKQKSADDAGRTVKNSDKDTSSSMSKLMENQGLDPNNAEQRKEFAEKTAFQARMVDNKQATNQAFDFNSINEEYEAAKANAAAGKPDSEYLAAQKDAQSALKAMEEGKDSSTLDNMLMMEGARQYTDSQGFDTNTRLAAREATLQAAPTTSSVKGVNEIFDALDGNYEKTRNMPAGVNQTEFKSIDASKDFSQPMGGVSDGGAATVGSDGGVTASSTVSQNLYHGTTAQSIDREGYIAVDSIINHKNAYSASPYSSRDEAMSAINSGEADYAQYKEMGVYRDITVAKGSVNGSGESTTIQVSGKDKSAAAVINEHRAKQLSKNKERKES